MSEPDELQRALDAADNALLAYLGALGRDNDTLRRANDALRSGNSVLRSAILDAVEQLTPEQRLKLARRYPAVFEVVEPPRHREDGWGEFDVR